MKKFSNSKRAFTLIELLTVIAIIAILSAILVPTVGNFRTMAKKTSDANNLRNIASESLIYASTNGERLVENDVGITIMDVAYELSVNAGLDDPRIWTSKNETFYLPGGSIELNGELNPAYADDDFAFNYVVGLETWMPSTTPLAFSRKKTIEGATWSSVDKDLYGASGGHVAFLAGNVTWYDSLTNQLIDPQTGAATDSLVTATTFPVDQASTAITTVTPPAPPAP